MISDFNLFLTVSVFTVTLLSDAIWAFYMRRAAQGHALAAAASSLLIIITSGYVVMEYTHRPYLLLAAGAGAFFGTYIMITFDKRSKRKKK